AKLGVENSRGTRLVSVSGHVERAGNYEIEPGVVTLHDLLYADDLGGGIPGGHALKAVIPGGSSTVILKADELDVGYDFDSLGQLHTAMGSAGIIVLDDRCCIVQLGIRFSEFYEHESCGKCTPCREGNYWMVRILRRLENGQGTEQDLTTLLDTCDNMLGRSFCALGDGAASPVTSSIAFFRDEYEAHVAGGCPFRPARTLVGAH
ncbi:MAG TPA: NADH-ubiquinone oxidoreductase-F iron-sulfur binding region domain-containing protein, partial [Mycobacteriales bacterium]|nr:NADH-ubiquinone oxidoreductase-F iron-sulfur binding region domain-containing protein [Mycobacteriales bacterium]